MRELFRRLFLDRRIAAEILVSSFFVNLLSLASPIFVIQILSRYIAYGFDGTLITLTMGMVLAVIFSFGFSIIRNRLAAAVSAGPDQELSVRTLDILTRVREGVISRLPQARIQELMAGPQVIQAAYEPQRINSVLDMPFFLLFLWAVYILNFWLALITLLAVACTLASGWLSMRRNLSQAQAMREESIAHRGLVNSAIQGSETVRVFMGRSFLMRTWDRQIKGLFGLRQEMGEARSLAQSILGALGAMLRVSVYAVGAKEVVAGNLTVGALIGASILSSKALQIASSFIQTYLVLAKAGETMGMLGEFQAMPLESSAGSALKVYSGRLEFKDLGFAYPGMPGPLFESLNLKLEPGAVLGIGGPNGSGKTTLARIAVGVIDPGRGQVLADGMELRQLSPEWWRRQVMYMPQEPTFLNGSIRDNILLANPNLDNEALNEIVRLADLRNFLDISRAGLETDLAEGGKNLPVGVRRRLALARALVVQGRLAVFDEPTEGLDADGCAAVYGVLNLLVKKGVTMIVVSSDANILKGAGVMIDLGTKPVPKVLAIKRGRRGQGSERPAKGGAANV
ncbi:MAG: ATP-binding cassette domain-containing protein [Desulfovibrionaceae bacterium]|nr:ATP-binding cassette domain-containing protein [Desulfovibrionaceae bacterium]